MKIERFNERFKEIDEVILKTWGFKFVYLIMRNRTANLLLQLVNVSGRVQGVS